MSKTILLHEITLSQLQEAIGEQIRAELKSLLSQSHEGEVLLSRTETADFLKIDLSTLAAWTRKRKLPSYAIMGRRYYKKAEILSSLTEL